MVASSLRIAHVASEMAPLVKVGGLADVVGALAFEQARRGHQVIVVLPRYLTVPVVAVLNTSDFAIWATSQPTARAASTAVRDGCADSITS